MDIKFDSIYKQQNNMRNMRELAELQGGKCISTEYINSKSNMAGDNYCTFRYKFKKND